MDVNEFYAEYADEVRKAAHREYKSSQVTEPEDIEQSVWEALLKSPQEWGAKRAHVVTIINKKAKLYAEKERMDYMYFSGAYVYNPQMVRSLLAGEVWCPADECMDPEARVDLARAFDELARRKPAQAHAVFRRFGLKDDYSSFTGGQKANESFGIDFMTHHLNGRAPIKTEDLDEVVNAGIV